MCLISSKSNYKNHIFSSCLMYRDRSIDKYGKSSFSCVPLSSLFWRNIVNFIFPHFIDSESENEREERETKSFIVWKKKNEKAMAACNLTHKTNSHMHSKFMVLRLFCNWIKTVNNWEINAPNWKNGKNQRGA